MTIYKKVGMYKKDCYKSLWKEIILKMSQFPPPPLLPPLPSAGWSIAFNTHIYNLFQCKDKQSCEALLQVI